MNEIIDILTEIENKQKEVNKLSNQLAFSLWLEMKFPNAKWPVFSAVVREDNKYMLRIRDSGGTIAFADFKDVPKNVWNTQTHVKKLYDTDKEFRNYVIRDNSSKE